MDKSAFATLKSPFAEAFSLISFAIVSALSISFLLIIFFLTVSETSSNGFLPAGIISETVATT